MAWKAFKEVIHMKKLPLPAIGMRKLKSIFAVFLSFLLWQILRIFFPNLSIHPFYSYVYAVVEMRGSLQETTTCGKRRMISTCIGITVGLLVLPLWSLLPAAEENYLLSPDILIILSGVLVTLWVADLCKCQNYCAMAAVVFLFCVVRNEHSLENTYVSALVRVTQTLIGVISAWVVNAFICKYPKNNINNKENHHDLH